MSTYLLAYAILCLTIVSGLGLRRWLRCRDAAARFGWLLAVMSDWSYQADGGGGNNDYFDQETAWASCSLAFEAIGTAGEPKAAREDERLAGDKPATSDIFIAGCI